MKELMKKWKGALESGGNEERYRVSCDIRNLFIIKYF